MQTEVLTTNDIWGDRDQCCQKEWTRYLWLQSEKKSQHETEDQDLEPSPQPQPSTESASHHISPLQLAALGAVWLGLPLQPSFYSSFNSIHYLMFTASSESIPWLDAKPILFNFPSMTRWFTILNAFQIVLIAAYTQCIWPAICNHNEVPSPKMQHPEPVTIGPIMMLIQAGHRQTHGTWSSGFVCLFVFGNLREIG